MTYAELKALTEGNNLPLFAENEKGESVIIEQGNIDGLSYFQLTTFQRNNWIRINKYYEDGSVDETFDR